MPILDRNEQQLEICSIVNRSCIVVLGFRAIFLDIFDFQKFNIWFWIYYLLFIYDVKFRISKRICDFIDFIHFISFISFHSFHFIHFIHFIARKISKIFRIIWIYINHEYNSRANQSLTEKNLWKWMLSTITQGKGQKHPRVYHEGSWQSDNIFIFDLNHPKSSKTAEVLSQYQQNEN
jgi:hypothetical protein